MRLPDLSTPQPTLVIGEPGCPDLAGLTAGARHALLLASLGSLRPGGSGWFGPDKLHSMWVGVLPGVGDRYQQSCACGQLDHGAPANQEEADIVVADELERRINPKGLAVMVTARHQPRDLARRSRDGNHYGDQHHAPCFRDSKILRSEFLALIKD